MNFKIEKLQKFEKEFKYFKNKFRTLEKDFENFLKYSLFLFLEKDINSNCFFPIEWIWVNANENIKFFVAKKFTCASLKWKWAKSWLRIVCCFDKINSRIIFVEMYYKGDKEVEDLERVREVWRGL